jgi:outer membrane protein insertion porin family
VQGRFVLTKRNFDITRLPSSINPLTIVSEIAENKAFHGGGQNLEFMVAPGTEISLFQIAFHDPDVFGQHFDTVGLRVNAFRRLQYLDSFKMDALGAVVGLERNFTDDLSVGMSFREETVEVEDIDANAPTIVWDAEGSTELRGVRLNGVLQDLDNFGNPTDGYNLRGSAEVVGGFFGGDESFYKLGLVWRQYFPLHRDALERTHVFSIREQLDYGHGFDDSDDLFLTERFYMGGSTLRGFDQRRAGPSQFGQPLGGEVRFLSRLEYEFPLVSTRRERSLRETEILRGVVFSDFGLLGLSIDDPELRNPRMSVGFGVRIQVPVIAVPIALDLAWPILDENSDEQRQFFFSLARF